MKSVFFKNLNTLRFIAVMMVIIHHFNFDHPLTGNELLQKGIQQAGKLGVMLFFVISGFLITYLLLLEKQLRGEVSIINFYVRRILRIWPLYFLVVLSSLFLLNQGFFAIAVASPFAMQQHFAAKCFLYLAMLPNVAHAAGLILPFAEQSWSVGVEEQFYLLWPMLLIKSRRPVLVLITVIGTYTALRVCIAFADHNIHSIHSGQVNYFFSILSVDVMSLGALAACFQLRILQMPKLFYSKVSQYIILIGLVILLLLAVDFGFFQYQVYGILFSCLVLQLISERSIFRVEHSALNYLGKISYGLYMFHFIGFRIADIFAGSYLKGSGQWLHFLLAFLFTLFLSIVSYELMEKYFIKLKSGFSYFLTGDSIYQVGAYPSAQTGIKQ